MDLDSWTRTPPITQVKSHHLAKPSSASPSVSSRNKENSSRPHQTFSLVDAHLRSGEYLIGGLLSVLGPSLCTWRGRVDRSILGPGRENQSEVTLKLDYSTARMIQVEGTRLVVSGDVLHFKHASDADSAADLLSQKHPPTNRRRRSLDFSEAPSDLSPRPSPRRRNAVALSPSHAERLREQVRDFVASNSASAAAAVRILAPEYPLEPVVVSTLSPPKFQAPTNEQLQQLRPLVSSMVQSAQQDKLALEQQLGIVVHSPDPRQGRHKNAFSDLRTGEAVSPSEYERRYLALLGLVPSQAKRRAELAKRLEHITSELHATFDAALAKFSERKGQIERELEELGGEAA